MISRNTYDYNITPTDSHDMRFHKYAIQSMYPVELHVELHVEPTESSKTPKGTKPEYVFVSNGRKPKTLKVNKIKRTIRNCLPIKIRGD